MRDALVGTIRIRAQDLQAYMKTSHSWKKSSQKFPHLLEVVKFFKAHNNFKILIDKKDSRFLKGELSPQKEARGTRINVTPDNKVIDKAYSLFADNLTIHDQSSDDHWDVIYKNKGGTFSYCYTLEKKDRSTIRKFKKVHQFDKVYLRLYKKVLTALTDKNDFVAMPMHTMLKTLMRIGNETYYRAHGHKGLTTLKKKDIKINQDTVTFKYLAKSGVPTVIKQKFSSVYLKRLNQQLKKLKAHDFVFTSPKTKSPLHEEYFKKGFKKYCGHEFYPHIIRSHYATMRMNRFLQNKRKISKEEAKRLFLELASRLGHKKFVQKTQHWENSYTVTLNHYVDPLLVKKIKSRIV
jgi:hypothetical protein